MTNLFKQNLILRAFGFFKIPLVWYVGASVVESTPNKIVIKIPLNRRTKNHLNVMYFGALSIGADLSVGLKAYQVIQESKSRVDLIFKDFKADFLKRAEGDVHFIVEQGEAVKALVQKAIASGERETMPVHGYAIVPSISEEKVMTFTLSLSLKNRPKK